MHYQKRIVKQYQILHYSRCCKEVKEYYIAFVILSIVLHLVPGNIDMDETNIKMLCITSLLNKN